jgi:hypothetical protein
MEFVLSVYVSTLVCNIKGETQTKGGREEGAEENIWTKGISSGLSNILGFHGSDYEKFRLLGY